MTSDKTDTFPLGESITEFSKKIIDATKCTNAYPQGATRDLYCAYPSFGRIIDEQSVRLLGLIAKVLKWQNIRGNIQLRPQDEQFEMLLECNDTIFERLQSNLDELTGIKRRTEIIVSSRLKSFAKGAMVGSWNITKSPITSTVTAKLVTVKNIDRPQKKFQIPVDNSSQHPFTPKLKYKPNAIKPLAILPEYDQDGNIISYLHPYEFELNKLAIPLEALTPKVVEKFKDINATTLTFVDTEERLRESLEELLHATELAIDVEHHAHRSFMGFTCLLQISTKFKDYIFDALALREELHILNEILTNPKVVKIFHGADYDIEWLQRDLSLYVVNMFDTHQAARTLNFARFSLAHLIKHYCDIEVDKSFQLADWRVRPLPDDLIAYARQDTHYLIYIYENLVNDLWKAGNQEPKLLRSVLQRSTELCKKRYMKPIITPESHLDMYRKSKKLFDNRQLYALREIFQWRDVVARNEDESYNFVLPNHMMMQIAENLPREMQGILACCNPIPPLVKQHLQVLHQILLKARQQSLVKARWLANEPIHRRAYLSLRDYSSKLYCPHDLTHCEEFRDDLPTLLKFQNGQLLKNEENAIQSLHNQMAKPILSVFDRFPNIHEQMETVKIKQNDKLLLPYKRYLAVLPAIEREIRQEAARIEAENNRMQLCPTDSNIVMEKIVDGDTSETKSEKKKQQHVTSSESIRDFLKRKYENLLIKKSLSDVDQKTEYNIRNCSKRMKTDTAQQDSNCNDDKLSFTNLSKQRYQSQPAEGKSTSTFFALKINNNNEISTLGSGPPTSDKDQSTISSKRNQLDSRKQMSKRKKTKLCRKSFQSSDKPVIVHNFDYSTVDFKKFEGGAQKINSVGLKQQLCKKTNSRIVQSKKFNKLLTFSKLKSVSK